MKMSSMRLLLSLFLLLLINSTRSQNSIDLKASLINFLRKLSSNNPLIDRDLNWTTASDPCLDRWKGIVCNKDGKSIHSIVLESLQLDGNIDGNLLSQLCNSSPLSVLSLKNNALNGDLPSEISSCTRFTHVYLSNNHFSGTVPWNMSRISGLLTFLSDNNQLTGAIPEFNWNFMNDFDFSFNRFSGPVPANSENFPVSKFEGNPGLCGKPLSVECPPPPSLLSLPPLPSPSSHNSKKTPLKKLLMVFGYVLFALVIVLFLVYIFLKKKKNKSVGHIHKEKSNGMKVSDSSDKSGSATRSEYSISSPAANNSEGVSTSLVVLRKDVCKDLKFEELLRAPAELLGKGRFGSLYKVAMNGNTELAVKRIKDWSLSGEEFKNKVMKMDEASHPNVLPIAAFYCSKQEKLVVYAFQKNGSLYKLLHDNTEGKPFPWKSRLNVAAGVAAGLSSMHRSLKTLDDAVTATGGVGHGNLKSSNILLSATMDPLISEYGLTALPTHRHESAGEAEAFAGSTDVYDIGVIFLELLTGKPSHGFNLAQWVHSVVREEWTVEVFDRSLLGDEEIAEETMMRLLQLSLQCMNSDVKERPSVAEVAAMVAGMKEEY